MRPAGINFGLASPRMRALIAATAAVVAALVPSAAFAQGSSQPGVHVDPGSPAGKEYQIPVTAARAEASGGPPGSAAGSGADSPLFGRGITPSSGTAGTGASSRTGTGGAPKQSPPTHVAHRAGPGGSVAASPLAPAAAGSPPGRVGSNSWLPLIGGGALVLVLGGGGGLAFRRRFLRA